MRGAGTAAAVLLGGAGLAWWLLASTVSTAATTGGRAPVRGGAAPAPDPAAAAVAEESAGVEPGARSMSPPATRPDARSAPAVPEALTEVQPRPRSAVADLRGMLELPDGTFVPTLNGVEFAPALARSWHPPIPWSPILRMETGPDGVQWYVHADGSRSTTVMGWNPQQQVWTAVTRVGHPTAAPSAPPGPPGPGAPVPNSGSPSPGSGSTGGL